MSWNRRFLLASSATVAVLVFGAGAADAATTIWHVIAEGGVVKTRHRDDHTGDPKTNITVDDKQVYRGRIEFTLVITKDGNFTHQGFGTYSQATWHVEGTNGDKGPISCDPVERTNSPFAVDVSGYAHGGAVPLHMNLTAQETNQDTPCGADFTAFGSTTTYLADSLTAVNGDHLRLDGMPIAPVLKKHTVTNTATVQTTIDAEWHFTATCSGACLPNPVVVKEQQRQAAAAAAADYHARKDEDKRIIDALECNLHTPGPAYACAFWRFKLAYDDTMMRDAQQLAADPPDQHFHNLARARPLKLPRLPGPRRSAPSALLSSYAGVGGLARALVTTINRADAAALAANGAWTLRQNRAASRFARRMVALLRRQSGLARRAGRDLVRARLLNSRRAALLTDSSSRRAVIHMIRALKKVGDARGRTG